jgi:type II secretory pathway pseudopilin PulG
MDTPLTVAIISAAAAIVVPAISFYLTKSKERQADWQRL